MECYLKLRCLRGQYGTESAETVIPLYRISHQDTGATDIQISDTITLFEEGIYACSVLVPRGGHSISAVELFLNNESIGYGSRAGYTQAKWEKPGEAVTFTILFKDDSEGKEEAQPFLLQYDLVKLSVGIKCNNAALNRPSYEEGYPGDRTSYTDHDDEAYVYFTSDYLPCLSKYSDNAETKETIIKTLLDFDDDKISDWIFPIQNTNASSPNTFLHGGWQKNSYKSLGSYIQMVESICKCYEKNYPALKSNVKHTIAKQNFLQCYEKIRNITTSSLQWLFQNSEQLVEVQSPTAITLDDKYYLPYRINIEKSIKSFDIYENRVILGFLRLVYNHTRYIETQLKHDIETEDKNVDKLQKMEQNGLRISVLPVKRIQIYNSRSQLSKLQTLILNLERQYPKYQEILQCFDNQLTGIPKKTKVFQEVQPYQHIFEQIIEWYRFGEFKLLKENFIFNIKTMDVLFEYYCLYKLLLMLKGAGFTEPADGKAPSKHYVYKPASYLYQCDIANTYFFEKETTRITLYYQPVIRPDAFENNITLYRTTSQEDCYTPDFMLKVEHEQAGVSYFIMDAKYSTGEVLKKYYIDKTILKYSCQISGIEKQAVKMVWLFYGRTDSRLDKNSIDYALHEKYHNSPLADKYKPDISYAILPVNSKTDMSQLWQEICRIIPALADTEYTEICTEQ